MKISSRIIIGLSSSVIIILVTIYLANVTKKEIPVVPSLMLIMLIWLLLFGGKGDDAGNNDSNGHLDV